MDPYRPESLPIEGLDYARLIKKVGEANASLAEYSGLLQGVVNPTVLLSPLTQQEAVLSSRIEGTIATLEEVFEHESGKQFEKRKEEDIQEILNYRKALALSTEFLKGRPIRLSFILEIHKILIDSVRGYDKNPGEFRTTQNWIGRHKGDPIEKAIFIPPNPLVLRDYLEQWENYLAFDDLDPLLQASIVHAQFELLHPFSDGNGRIGRLIIPLFLYSKKRLYSPMFYISAYLEDHREEYYARLRAISQNKEWTEWVEFFLEAICVQAKDNIQKTRQILELFTLMKDKVRSITHSQYSHDALNAIFDRPIFAAPDFAKRSKIPKPTANKILSQFLNFGILKCLQKGEGRRASILAFPPLLNIVEGKPVF
jgi:Fic family protein